MLEHNTNNVILIILENHTSSSIVTVTLVNLTNIMNVLHIRPFVILRIVRPRIFESKFRNHCAKKLDGALRKPTSFVYEFA